MHTQPTLPARAAPVAATLPVHPRRSGWRAGAASALVLTAVADLRAGRSPRSSIRALSELGGCDLPSGLAGAEELDRRLRTVLAGWARDVHRNRPTAADPVAREDGQKHAELVDRVVDVLFATLPTSALDGCPHPGEWVASSVDVVPCAVHGYEGGPVDCLGRLVRAHLAEVVDRAGAAGSAPAGDVSLAEQVRAASDLRPGNPVDGATAHQPVLATLWLGVATLAAWQAHAATL